MLLDLPEFLDVCVQANPTARITRNLIAPGNRGGADTGAAMLM